MRSQIIINNNKQLLGLIISFSCLLGGLSNSLNAYADSRVTPVIKPSSTTHWISAPVQSTPSFVASKANQISPYSLADILKKVPDTNPVLKAAEKRMLIDKAEIQIAKQPPNPQIMGYVGFGPTTTVMGNPHQAGINQMVETGGKHHKRIAITEAQYEADLAHYNALAWETQNEAWLAYVNVLASESNIDLLNEQADFLDKLVDIASKRFNAGVAAESELLQAKLSRKQIVVHLMEAENTLKIARSKLNAFVGNTLPDDYVLLSTDLLTLDNNDALFPDLAQVLPDTEVLIEGAYKNRLDLKASALATTIGQKELKLARALVIPDILLSGGALFTRSPSPFSSPVESRNYGGGYLMATVDIPVFNQHKGEISAAQARISQANAEVEAKQAIIRTEMVQALMVYESAKKTMQAYHDGVLPDATKVVNLAQESYQYGKTGLANVIMAQESERETRQGYLDSIVNLIKAWGELQQAYGHDTLQ